MIVREHWGAEYRDFSGRWIAHGVCLPEQSARDAARGLHHRGLAVRLTRTVTTVEVENARVHEA